MFRVHTTIGKFDVPAETADEARKVIAERYPDAKITKIKMVR